MNKSEPVELELPLLHETAYAYLTEYDGKELWLPKSQVTWDDGTFTIPEWLAIDKGLV